MDSFMIGLGLRRMLAAAVLLLLSLWGRGVRADSPGSTNQYLVRSSQGGDGLKPAGVWGGRLLPSEQGLGQDLFKHGFSRLGGLAESQSGIQVIALSHDPVRHNILVVSEQAGVTSMAMGSLCESDVPGVIIHNVRMTDANHPYLQDSECGAKCGWGPVAVYDGQVYFVLSAVFGKIYNQLFREIQIRRLDTTTERCASVLASVGPRNDSRTLDFPVLDCSYLVSSLLRHEYKKPSPRPTLWLAHHLAVGTYQGKLHFYTQLFNTSGGGSAMALVHSQENSAAMNELYSRDVDSVYTGTLRLRGLGSVDYRSGVLCWTAADTLLCSAHTPGGGVRPEAVLERGEAVTAGVCTGNIPQAALRHTLTGVSVAETRDALAVYFGCYAEMSATGGVGLVTVTLHGLQTSLHAVKSSGRRIYGSHVIVLDKLGGRCFVPDEPLSTAAAATSTAVSDTTSSVALTTSSVILTTIATTVTTAKDGWFPWLKPKPTKDTPACACPVSAAQTNGGRCVYFTGYTVFLLLVMYFVLH